MNNFHDLPLYRFAPLSVEDCEEICRWRYASPYDLYNWESWEEMKAGGLEFADPFLRETQYAGVWEKGARDVLSGFVQFFPLTGTTRLGLGLRPDLCGQGRGPAFVRACAGEALRRKPGDAVDLEVLVWNERARIVYERAGFRITDRYERMTPSGPMDFYCMEYQQKIVNNT